jgi:hypothetical protein
MRERSLPIAMPYAEESAEGRLPIWLCATLTVSVSVGCYWLIFRLIAALWT